VSSLKQVISRLPPGQKFVSDWRCR